MRRVIARREEYPVVGSTLAQLASMIAMLGPVRGGRRFSAYTDWQVHWAYQRVSEGDLWRATDVTVTVTLRTTLPRWHPCATADAALARAWSEYVSALEVHEAGHAALAEAAAQALCEGLCGLSPEPSREALDARATATAHAVVEEHRRREADYDRETEHGARQGCSLEKAPRAPTPEGRETLRTRPR